MGQVDIKLQSRKNIHICVCVYIYIYISDGTKSMQDPDLNCEVPQILRKERDKGVAWGYQGIL